MGSKVLFAFVFKFLFVSFTSASWELEVPNYAFDTDLYDRVLDPELCHEQIRLIQGDSLLQLMFADSSIRIPRGILLGNNIDLGSYHQCLAINQPVSNRTIQGKYCMINVPMRQSFELPDWPFTWLSNFDPTMLRLDDDTIAQFEAIEKLKLELKALSGFVDEDRIAAGGILSELTFRMAVCIPEPCSTQQAITSLLFNVSAIGFDYTEEFCRLPDDKPWVPGDYVVIVVFAIVAILAVIGTSYDIWHSYYSGRDPSSANKITKSFSVINNGRRLWVYTSNLNNLECMDGIRCVAIAWVILGHAYTTEPFFANPLDGFQWQISYKSLWVRGGHFAVDTFFTLSGLLLVYTTAGKLNGIKLLKNLHLFYLNRLLRMFPLLAIAVLIDATYLNRMADGPYWQVAASYVQSCRANWWSTLLHIQNYATPRGMCLVHSWYLAVDTQLHILSPIVLVFVLSGKRKVAWSALGATLLGIMAATTAYNFIKEFPTSMGAPGREHEFAHYLFDYYLHTFPRSPPFVVGMVFGYLIHVARQTKLTMNKFQVTCLWVITFAASTFVMYADYPTSRPGWDNRMLDNFYNTFLRPLWAMSTGLLIFICVTGYGGPVDWFLSLRIFKVPSRISYAMYLFHYVLMVAVNSSTVAPMRFSVSSMTFKFLGHYTLTLCAAFLLTLLIDSPASSLFKLLLGQGSKKARPKEVAPRNEIEIEVGDKKD